MTVHREIVQSLRETGGTAEADDGSRSEFQGFRNFEFPTSVRAFLACRALHAPRPVALVDFFSILLG